MVLWTRYYMTALRATVFGKPQQLSLAWGEGKTIIVAGKLNEKLRNVVRTLPPETIASVPGFPLTIKSGGMAGLLYVPQKRMGVYYNINPGAVTVELRPNSRGRAVLPDGAVVNVKGLPAVELPHGAWLKLEN